MSERLIRLMRIITLVQSKPGIISFTILILMLY
jgi:hypothetical protein